jgi:hypothetical protein
MAFATNHVPRSRPIGRGALVVHAVVVAILGAAFLAVAWPPTPDANIGAGVLALPLLAVGAPWSLLSFFASTDHGYELALVAAAVLNLALHAFVVRRRALGEAAARV